MKKNILSYNDIKDISFGDSNEPLVAANTYDTKIVCEYKKFDMFAWTGFDILVRDSVARKLAQVNNMLQKYELNLKVVYGYRSLDVQKQYFNKQYDQLKQANPAMNDAELSLLTHNYVAVPDAAGHTLGAAVDLTLTDINGECDMGTAIADYTDPIAIQTFAIVNKSQKKLRAILLKEMMRVGFAPFLGEWWHFSYGDKEWATYYNLDKALYSPVTTSQRTQLFLIAGGNKTALQVAKEWKGDLYNKLACESLMKTFSDIDQAGIYYESTGRLEMAGGEFCGNATAATAALRYSNALPGQNFQVSGFENDVTAIATETSTNRWTVTTSFKSMPYHQTHTTIFNTPVDIIDFGGIAHILLKGVFPDNYLTAAQEIRAEANLAHSSAVGVIWYTQNGNTLHINPVVWVKEINSQFYESSCGSGAIAAAITSGKGVIVQPSAETILVDISKEVIKTITGVVRI